MKKRVIKFKRNKGLDMNAGVDYKLFYEILLNLREIFHSYGRIDDSNAKLDEIVKIIMMSYQMALHGKRFSLANVKKIAEKKFKNSTMVAKALRQMFDEVAKESLFQNNDGTNIFGAQPALNIQPSENLLAENFIAELEKIDFVNLVSEKRNINFDIVNECFGHFVRENFRNNKEDAQYMTPSEITDSILSIVFYDFEKEDYFEHGDDFIVMDPTCGVGTLLIESARKYVKYLTNTLKNPQKQINFFLKNGVLGQDKVDRMVRLSKINSLLFGCDSQNIFAGNSVVGESKIDSFKGKVDFIFTNPPFGAEYETASVSKDFYFRFESILREEKYICSELLLLLKSVYLLKPNGKLAIVLPDCVFSAKGLFRKVREYLLSNYVINGIFELPAVTFAQAGTRTKTSVLYLTNRKPKPDQKIIMARCDDIGYIVKERNGVPVKIAKGVNQMVEISSVCSRTISNCGILSENPSVTVVRTSDLLDSVLTPNFYAAERFKTLDFLTNGNLSGYEIRPLSDLVRIETIGRKNMAVCDKVKHISVLHVNADCTIDFQQVQAFNPISKGRLCKDGDVLFSKINPRIPRMAVVPKYERTLVCSNEFEIMRPIMDVGAYVVCFLLKTSYVAAQIENLTSGTSSSHSRIKREQLSQIKVPYPISKKTKKLFADLNEKISIAIEQKYNADSVLEQQFSMLDGVLR
ncbi:N-6 DNA methylase [uncultured Fibrobacter sp.]|uniref:N-6 DNA methylase n=1 Tax=uncultured Fibrobacter sp. TaxID=261512 RepID=UPI0025F6F0A7|nr:N-6 DNA methylase [uncultured Fibrobacter sp.]